jgi:hypothetical protein
LRLIEAPLFAAAPKRREGVEVRNSLRGVLEQMAGRPVAQLEHQVASVLGRFGVQFAENVLDETLIFLDLFRFDAIADELRRHW